MQCVNPVRLFHLPVVDYPDGLLVPCGKCISCRMAKRREWSMRMLHELCEHADACFLTLTYDEDHLPHNSSLAKRDLQLFFKRLRKALGARKIRYFACGEYGDQSERPHYHAIIFGLSILSAQQMLGDVWTYGLYHIGLAEPDSIQYVAQYIDKKLSGDMAQEQYEDRGREPVFRIMSLGIGRAYCDREAEIIRSRQMCTVRGKAVALPRYYVDRLGITREDRLDYAVEANRLLVERHTEIADITADELYHRGSAADYRRYEDGMTESNQQHERNLSARVALRQSDL